MPLHNEKKESVDTDENQLFGYYRSLRTTIKPKDHTKFFQTYKNCFTGKEVVVVLEKKCNLSRDRAIQIAQVLLDKKLIVHVTHRQKFKNTIMSFYRFTNERRSLRHSMKSITLDEKTMAEIQKIISMQDDDDEIDKEELFDKPHSLESYYDLKLDLTKSSKRYSAETYVEEQQSSLRQSRIFNSSASPVPPYHHHRKEKMTVFMSREHDSMDQIALAIKKKKLELQREAEEKQKLAYIEPDLVQPSPRIRDTSGLDAHAKVRVNTLSIGSDRNESLSPRTISPSSNVASPMTSPRLNTPEESADSTTGTAILRRTSSIPDDNTDILDLLKVPLPGKKSKKKLANKTDSEASSSESLNSHLDESALSPRVTLVNFFKNRKLQKAGEKIVEVAPVKEEQEKLALKQIRRRSSELGGMFLVNSTDKLLPSYHEVPWSMQHHRHRMDPNKIQNRVDIFRYRSIEEVLEDPDAKNLLQEFAEDEFADENIKFWDDLTKYRQETLLSHRIEFAKYLFETYVDPKAPLALNINLKAVEECRKVYHTGAEDAFYPIQVDVLQALCDLLERLRFSVQKQRIAEMDKFVEQEKHVEEKPVDKINGLVAMEGLDAFYKVKY